MSRPAPSAASPVASSADAIVAHRKVESAHGASKLLGIEAGRGVAASIVVLYHVARHLKAAFGELPFHGITQFGHAGVDFFFVLSGFIIFYVHGDDLGRPDRIGRYASRRFTRIFPFYWVALFFTILTLLASHGRGLPGLAELAANLVLLPRPGEPIIGVAWTLEHEVTFYVLFGLMILHRRIGIAVMTLWAGLVAAGYAGLAPPESAGGFVKLFSPFNIQFFMGIAAALACRQRRVPGGGIPAALLGFGLFLAAAAAENLGFMDGYEPPARLAYGMASMLIVMGIVTLEASGRLKVSGPFALLGKASYAIYLVQFLWIGAVWQVLVASGLDRISPVWLLFLALSVGGIGGGILTSQLIEQPVTRLWRRLLKSGADRLFR